MSVRINMEDVMRTSTITPPFPKYPKIMIVMHWITLAAVVIGVVAIYTRGLVEGRALRSGLLALHRSCELVVLVTVTLRMAFYFYARRRVQHDLPAAGGGGGGGGRRARGRRGGARPGSAGV